MRVMLQGNGRCLEIRGEQAARSGKKHEKYLKERIYADEIQL